jgi:5-formyltetrahydrofolate cyclo-ligase
VDVIVTPTAVIRTPARHRPPGILWDHLDDSKRASIPVLRER